MKDLVFFPTFLVEVLLLVVSYFFQLKHVVSIDSLVAAAGIQTVHTFAAPLHAKLDVGGIDALLLGVGVAVPEVDFVIVCSRGHILHVPKLEVVGCDDSSSLASSALGHAVHIFADSGVVDLESLGVSLHDQEVLQFVDVEHALNFGIMLFIVSNIASIVIFDSVNEGAVLSYHT